MAYSLIANALQVNFDSVLTFPEEGMVNMFKALESTGLHGFLGFPYVLYEQDLEKFFSVAFVRENEVISVVQGKLVQISEEQFAGAFGLPIARLTEMTEVPKDLVYDATRIFSASGEPVKTSCKKREMKFEFLLMNDILAKSVTVKDRSFDAVTHERFLLMTGAPNLTLGEAKTFQPPKILTMKTVGTYIAKNKSISIDEDEPVEKVVKKAATKRRPTPAVVEPVAKKNRTTVGRAAPTEKDLVMVPVVQNPEPISILPAVTPRSQRRHAPKRKLVLRDESDDENFENIIKLVLTETTEVEDVETDLEEPVVMKTVGSDPVETESRIDVSSITNYDEDRSLKVLSNEEGPLVETEKEKEKDKGKSVAQMLDSTNTEPLSKVLEPTENSTSDEESMSIDDLLAQIPEDMMLPSVTATEPTKITFGSGIDIRERDWYKESLHQIPIADKGKAPLVEKDEIKGHPPQEMFSLICADIEFLIREKVIEEISSFISSFSLHRLEILESVSNIAAKEEQMLAWAETDFFADGCGVATVHNSKNLNSSRSSSSSDSRMLFTADDLPEISPTDDVLPVEETPDAQISLPTAGVPSTDYTEAVAQLRATVDQISIEHVKTRLHLDELKAVLFKKISSLQTAFLTASDNQDRVVLSQTNVLHKDMQAHKDAMSKELDAMRKEVQDQKAAITKDLLEFHVEAQENFHTLSAHLAELIAYINRDRDDKKGEASSSRVPQPPDDRSGRGRGSRSEPPRKRGGSTSSRGFRYWLGGS
ncbi:hypothetical protein F511_29601 [Dorcoceras hygrometricum]|uniref:Splicing factor 3B subunit 1-like n=1 Tax=Dorcoceras hygrometricum TaxID=472368 RepID=A0A2Z7B1J2_9LAMI|nr:hypothetical protein F511_29601 [Dorcoceras hygrometricum]